MPEKDQSGDLAFGADLAEAAQNLIQVLGFHQLVELGGHRLQVFLESEVLLVARRDHKNRVGLLTNYREGQAKNYEQQDCEVPHEFILLTGTSSDPDLYQVHPGELVDVFLDRPKGRVLGEVFNACNRAGH